MKRATSYLKNLREDTEHVLNQGNSEITVGRSDIIKINGALEDIEIAKTVQEITHDLIAAEIQKLHRQLGGITTGNEAYEILCGLVTKVREVQGSVME